MATAAGRRLTEAHRLAQLRLGTVTVRQMRTIWHLLDPADLDRSFEAWLTTALPIVQAQRFASAQIAANYLRTFRQIETGTPATPVLNADMNHAVVSTSLLVTGPVSIKRAMTRGVPLVRALQTAEAASAAAAMRHALDGGRETVSATLRADSQAIGYERVASGNACAFCADLDGKFHRDDTADFPAHDGCSCSQEPVYR